MPNLNDAPQSLYSEHLANSIRVNFEQFDLMLMERRSPTRLLWDPAISGSCSSLTYTRILILNENFITYAGLISIQL